MSRPICRKAFVGPWELVPMTLVDPRQRGSMWLRPLASGGQLAGPKISGP